MLQSEIDVPVVCFQDAAVSIVARGWVMPCAFGARVVRFAQCLAFRSRVRLGCVGHVAVPSEDEVHPWHQG